MMPKRTLEQRLTVLGQGSRPSATPAPAAVQNGLDAGDEVKQEEVDPSSVSFSNCY